MHANSRDWCPFSVWCVWFSPLLFLVGSQALQVHVRVFLNQKLLAGFGEDVCKPDRGSQTCVQHVLTGVFSQKQVRWSNQQPIKPSAQLPSAFSQWWKYGCCFHLGSYENSRRTLGERHMPNLLNSVPLDCRRTYDQASTVTDITCAAAASGFIEGSCCWYSAGLQEQEQVEIWYKDRLLTPPVTHPTALHGKRAHGGLPNSWSLTVLWKRAENTCSVDWWWFNNKWGT